MSETKKESFESTATDSVSVTPTLATVLTQNKVDVSKESRFKFFKQFFKSNSDTLKPVKESFINYESSSAYLALK